MSTCPEKELLSVYLDGELPQDYVKDFESHLAVCSDCAKLYNQFKNTHENLQRQNRTITLSDSYLEGGFERLQTKMRFSLVTQEAKKTSSFNFASFKKFAPALAAAVVFALILPIRFFDHKNNNLPQHQGIVSSALQKNKATLMKNRGVVSEMQSATLASFFANNEQLKKSNFESSKNYSPYIQKISKDISTSNSLSKTYNSIYPVRSLNGYYLDSVELSHIQNFDIFKPKFSKNADGVTINITLYPVISSGQQK